MWSSATPSATIVDPHHFVLFQHGVLGYAGDFDHIIEDVLVDHQLALEESRQYSHEQGGAPQTVSCSYHDIEALRAAANKAQAAAPSGGAPAKPPSSQITGTGPMRHAHDLRLPSYVTLEERRRHVRETFKLAPEYRGSGRLYEAEHLTLFAPGSNNFLRTNAGIHACTARLMAEFLPVFREWLSTVASIEAERRRAHEQKQKVLQERARAKATWARLSSGDGGEACDAADESWPTEGCSPPNSPAVTLCRGDSWAGFSLPSTTFLTAATSPEACPALTLGERGESDGYTPTPICFSVVGHSFGGLILREFLFLLLTNESQGDLDRGLFQEILAIRQQMQRLSVTFENFLTLATPHCGVSECLWWPLKIGAYCLDKIRIFPTYGELLTTDTEQQLRSRLLDRRHLLALRVFRRRTLFANTHRDLLVGFGAASLIFEDVDNDHTKARGFHRPRDVFCASAFETDTSEVSAPIYLPRYTSQRLDLRDSDDVEDTTTGSEHAHGEARRDDSPHAEAADSHYSVSHSRQASRRDVRSISLQRIAELAHGDAAADQEANQTHPPQYPAPQYVAPLMPRHTYDDLALVLTRPSSPCAESARQPHASLAGTAVPAAGVADAAGGTSAWENAPPTSPSPPASPSSISLIDGSTDEVMRRAGLAFPTPPREAPTPNDFAIRTVVREHRQWKAEEVAQQHHQRQLSEGAAGFARRHLRWRRWNWSERELNDTTTDAMDDLDAYARASSPATRSTGKTMRSRLTGRHSANASIGSLAELALLTSARPHRFFDRAVHFVAYLPVVIVSELWRRLRGRGGESKRTDDDDSASEEGTKPRGTTLDSRDATLSDSSDDADAGEEEKERWHDSAAHRMRTRAHRVAKKSGTRRAAARRDNSVVFEEHAKTLPTFVEMPRSIAYRLRKHLDWRVRAIRYKNRIPIAHVACLGNWSWAGQSPAIVQSIAEEVLRIL